MKLKTLIGLLLAASILFTSLPTLASSQWHTGDDDQGVWKIGAAYLYRDRPYTGYRDSRKDEVIPLIHYQGEKFYIRGNQLGYKLYDLMDKTMRFDIIAEYRNMGYRQSDSAAFSGNGHRHNGLDAGFRGLWQPTDLGMSILALRNISNHSEGTEFRGEIWYLDKVTDQWTVRPNASIAWQSGSVVKYYYGVRNGAGTPTRATYSGNDVINERLGLDVSYSFLKNWSALVSGAYEHYGSEIRKSSIVNEDHQWLFMLGFMYAFK